MSLAAANTKLSSLNKGWDWGQFAASPNDALHKSDLLTFARCPRKLFYSRMEKATGTKSGRIFANMIMGTAVHATLERALPWVIAKGKPADQAHIRMVYWSELEAALKREGADQKDMVWAKSAGSPDAEHKRKVEELYYFLMHADKRIKAVLGVEHEFVSVFRSRNFEIYAAGTLDIIFRSVEGNLSLADFKSGKLRPDQLSLDRGYELGFYAAALQYGEVGPEHVRYGEYPKEIYILATADFLPAAKDSARVVWQSDEAKYFDVKPGTEVKVAKGQQRGVGWYRANRDGSEMPSIMYGIEQMVLNVRSGKFFPVFDGKMCASCRFKEPCLNEGFLDLDKTQVDELEQMLANVPDDLGGDDETEASTL